MKNIAEWLSSYADTHGAHHFPDDDDFGSQSPADGENGHETKAKDHEIYAEDDFTSIEQPPGESGENQCASESVFRERPADQPADWTRVDLPEREADDKEDDRQEV